MTNTYKRFLVDNQQRLFKHIKSWREQTNGLRLSELVLLANVFGTNGPRMQCLRKLCDCMIYSQQEDVRCRGF